MKFMLQQTTERISEIIGAMPGRDIRIGDVVGTIHVGGHFLVKTKLIASALGHLV